MYLRKPVEKKFPKEMPVNSKWEDGEKSVPYMHYVFDQLNFLFIFILWGFDGYIYQLEKVFILGNIAHHKKHLLLIFFPKINSFFLDSFRQVFTFTQGNIRSQGFSGLAEIIEQAHNRTGVHMRSHIILHLMSPLSEMEDWTVELNKQNR